MIHLRVEDAGTTKSAYASLLKRHNLLQRYRREVMTDERKELQKALRAEAPKRTGKFARAIRTYTYDTPDGITHLEAFVGDEYQDLLNWIVGGTKAHEIPTGGAAAQLAKGYPLRFYWEKGPHGPDIYYYWRVWHPGTKPNNFPGRVLKTRYPTMVQNWRRAGYAVASTSAYTGE